MKREIKFRGIYPHSGQFFYGYFVNDFPETPRIVSENFSTPIKIETLGQFTGLRDKNGVEIYEGDIVNYAVKKKLCDCKDETDLFLGINKFCTDCGKPLTEKDFVTKCRIDFMNGSFVLYKEHGDDYYSAWATYIAETYIQWMEVIGNIHQKPELCQ